MLILTDIEIETIITEAFESLNTAGLYELDERTSYSYSNKGELISELNKLFKGLKSRGINTLAVKSSECKYCYPLAKTYSFHDSKTDEFIMRYVIHQENEDEFRFEECRNIPSRKDGMPF